MGKSNRLSNKSIISKDKLCDEDFDKLVIDTSSKVTQKSLINSKQEPHNSANSRGNQQQPSIIGTGSELNSLSTQPKRPMNAFMVWGQVIRRELHDKFSNVQNALLSKALGRVWRSLSPTEKEPYITKANQIKANHKRDYPDYRYRPRRIQEKRAKCNMLIGIHLNHPVNQHPKQNNFNFEQTFQSAHGITDPPRPSQQSNCFKQQRLINFKVGNDTQMSLNDVEIEAKDKRLSYGCETYQNPLHFETSSSGYCRIQPIVECRNNHLTRQGNECHEECYPEYQQNLSATTSNKQPAEYTYPPYQHQLTYNTNQQHYQQHQQQSQNLHYEAPSQTINSYLDTQASSRVTNTINGNINSYCPSVTQINQVKMYEHSNFNNYVI